MPKAKSDPLDVPVSEIPLPADEAMDDMLSNEPGVAQEKPAPKPPPPVEKLEFGGEKPREKTVPLEYPPKWQGELVTAIPLRRLTGAEVDAALAPENTNLMDIYAAMTGFPVSFLNGLDSDDRDRLKEEAEDFLPRSIRRAADSPSG